MSKNTPFALQRFAAACLPLWAATAGLAMAQDDILKPYLADIAPGPQVAHDFLGVVHEAVTNIQSPQDILLVTGIGRGSGGKAGFGLAFTPGRSDFRGLSVSTRDYVDKDLSRLWGSTTFSYAQNEAQHGGAAYRQAALFMHLSYYLNPLDDPLVAAFKGVQRCTAGMAASKEGLDEVLKQQQAMEKALGRRLNEQELQALEAKAKGAPQLAQADEATRRCASAAADLARKKWNASHLGLALGQGWIRPAAGGQRLVLGRHLSLTAAAAPAGWGHSLFHLNLQRSSRELDLTRLAGAPVYKSATQAALRYTYQPGETGKAYVLAEVSNARHHDVTQSTRAFKQALGVDYQLAKGLWMEWRWGRAGKDDGSGLQTKSLVNLKFTPSAGLPALLGGG
jgi:hypothetical protein